MSIIDVDYLSEWIGKTQEATAIISADTANLMQATLNRSDRLRNGDLLPPAWHWLYLHEPVVGKQLGVEGHPELGQFMPPVSFGGELPPRRMWAGGRLVFERPLRLGDKAVKRSVVKTITPKVGRSGKLVFVGVEHEVSVAGERCLLEEQTIVYRESVKMGESVRTAKPAPAGSHFSTTYTPDPIMLFRYSALTFNGHRIHYDVDFCREHEGYPSLVVHGPLVATLILDLFYQQGWPIGTFSYRGMSPLFNGDDFVVCGMGSGRAWATNHNGSLAMTAQVTLIS